MSLEALPCELLYKVVDWVRRDRREQITIPGLVADARNRLVAKSFWAASKNVPAFPFDAELNYDKVGGNADVRIVRSVTRGGCFYRNVSAGYPLVIDNLHKGLLIARDRGTGHVYALIVKEACHEQAALPQLAEERRRWGVTQAAPFNVPALHPSIRHTYDALLPISTHEKEFWDGLDQGVYAKYVHAELDVYELVIGLCGNNANYQYNMACFDQVFGLHSDKSLDSVGLRRVVKPDRRQHNTFLQNAVFVDAVQGFYSDLSKREMVPFQGPVGSNMSATFSLAFDRFAPMNGEIQGSLGKEIRMEQRRMHTTTMRTVDAVEWDEYINGCCVDTCVLNLHDDESPISDTDKHKLRYRVPSLCAMCGHFDEPKHAECGGWYVHIDNHGLNAKQLKLLVGPPRRHDPEGYRRRLAQQALDRAERECAKKNALALGGPDAASSSAETAILDDDSPLAAPRVRSREAAKQARSDLSTILTDDNDTYSTGEMKRKRQDLDDEHPGDDARFAADDEEEDPMYDSDAEYREHDTRTRAQKHAERFAEARNQMREQQIANMIPSDDEDDI
jgi:hypothetical protein